MRISIDGGKTFVDSSEVRICWDNLSNDDAPVSLHLTATPEGIVQDLINAEGEVVATTSNMAQETAEQLVDSDDGYLSPR